MVSILRNHDFHDRNNGFPITGLLVQLPELWLCHTGRVALKVRTGGSKNPGILKGHSEGLQEGRQEGHREGLREGRQSAVLELLGEKGVVSKELDKIIKDQKDLAVLTKWFKIAVRADTVEAFEKAIKEDRQI